MNTVTHLLKGKQPLRGSMLTPGESLAAPPLLLRLRRWAGTPRQTPLGRKWSLCVMGASHSTSSHARDVFSSLLTLFPTWAHLPYFGGCVVKSLHFIGSISLQPRSPSALQLLTGRLDTDWQLIPPTHYTEQCFAPTVNTMNLATHIAHIRQSTLVLSCRFACVHMGRGSALVRISSYVC